MPRVVPGRQHHRGLDYKVNRQGREGVPDQPQAPPLAFCAGP